MSRSDIMIQGAPKTEFDGTNTYRSLERYSYSAIADFLKDRRKFKKKYIDKEKVRSEHNLSMMIGDLVDVMLTDMENFDNRFIIFDIPKPKGQMGILVDHLVRITFESVEDEVVTRDFNEMFEEAFELTRRDKNGEIVKFLGKTMEDALFLFTTRPEKKEKKKKEGEEENKKEEEPLGLDYYKQALKHVGKTLITLQDYTNAENITNELKNNPFTADIINRETNKEWEVLRKYPILYTGFGHKLKSEIDILQINHKHKEVFVYDLKVTWSVEDFHYNYLKMWYYVQAGLYQYAVNQLIKDKNLKGYIIKPFSFIVADSINYFSPLIFDSTYDDIHNALHGFRINHRRYKGVSEALKEIAWHTDNNIWNCSMDNYLNNGRVPIGVVYDTLENKK